MARYQPAFLAIILVIFCGLVHGYWTDRWVTSQATAEAVAKLTSVPMNVGDWQGERLQSRGNPIEPIAGQLYRRYVNRINGTSITVALFTGLPGPVSIHTPDVCYKASGFEVTSPITYRYSGRSGEPDGAFLTADLHKTRATEQLYQRIFWSWTTTGSWHVPDDPRSTFAREPVVYKLYLVRELNSPDEPMEEDPCLELMHQLLPQLQKYLFAKPEE